MTNTKATPTPVVGMAATVCYLTDRHAATVVKVSASGSKVTVQEDTAKRTDANGMSEMQTYEYTANPQGTLHVFHRQGNGTYATRGTRLHLGDRRTYHDFSF